MPTDDRMDELAGSVSDGRPVDWKRIETGGGGDSDAARLRAMKEVERIARFNRELQRSPRPGERPGATGGGDAQPGRWGDLTLLEPIGAGSTGEVWRAWDATLQREVALKFLASRGVAADAAGPGDSPLLDEARALARVRHPGVVAVHGIAEHDGRAGMWMEYLQGDTLAETIERRGALPPGEVARIGVALCRALEAVDRAGLVHRDLKPANVILEADGRVVLTDFGLGWRRALSDVDAPRASGTPIFMSPGLLSGEAATPRSDLYALGVTLRWALTGRPPFRATTLDELKTEARTGPARPLVVERPDAPPRLAAAIEKAMAPEAEARFVSAAEMAAELDGALAEMGGGVAAVGDAKRRGRVGTLALAAALIVVVGGAIVLGRGGGGAGGGSRAIDAPGAPSARGGDDATAAIGYDVEATLVGRTGGEFRRLAPGDRVKPGDRLSLEFHASKPMWVYVLNQDEEGESYLLFPQPLFDRANPIAPDSTVVLPGTIGGRENAWTVTSRGGREHFLVVASPEPVADMEDELKRLPAAEPGRPIRYAAIPSATVEQLRGVGGVAPLPPDATPRAADTFERFRALAGRETVERGVWVRQITLENPLR